MIGNDNLFHETMCTYFQFESYLEKRSCVLIYSSLYFTYSSDFLTFFHGKFPCLCMCVHARTLSRTVLSIADTSAAE